MTRNSTTSNPADRARVPRRAILGLLGGIASGKSTVADIFEEHGHRVINADRIGHEVLTEPRVRDRIREEFGDAVLGADGSVNRKKLAARVFGDESAVERLNEITHGRIQRRIREQIDAFRESVATAKENRELQLLLLDVSLLASSPLRADCDEHIFVDADLEVRKRRCRDRGWSSGELQRREAHQVPLSQRRSMARWVIDNSESIDSTRRQVMRILQEIESGELGVSE